MRRSRPSGVPGETTDWPFDYSRGRGRCAVPRETPEGSCVMRREFFLSQLSTLNSLLLPEFPLFAPASRCIVPCPPGADLRRDDRRRRIGRHRPARMAEIKFRCPQCTQKIAVAASAAGVKIDCPTCHSRLVIPRSEIAPVEVLIRRKLAIVGGSADAVYQELQKMEVQAEKAAEELKRVRAENSAAALNAQQEIESLR